MRIMLAIEEVKDGHQLVEHLVERVRQPELDRYMIVSCVEPSDVDDFCTSIYGYDEQHQMLEQRVAAVTKEVEEVQSYLRRRIPGATSVETKVLVGTPKEVLVRLASEWAADQILVGSHKRGLDKLLLGSVSEAVVQCAPCTVAVVR